MADAVERPEYLYAVDLGDFVAERKALAARLRADGDRVAATAVMAMRKPPRSAWALNVLARAEPEVIEQVLDAARRVASAIAEGGDELRAAQRDYSHAVTATVDAAAQRSALAGDPLLEKMRATVLAAGADPVGEVAANLRAGTLATDAAAPGFSFAGMALAADDPPTGTAPPRRQAGSGGARRRAVESVADAGTDEPGADAAGIGAPTDAPTDTGTQAAAEDDRVAAVAAEEREAAAAAEKEAAEEEAAATARAERAAAAAAERRRARERTRLAREIDRRAQRVARLVEVADAAEAAAVEARTAATEAGSELQAAEDRLAQLERPGD
ncbi:MAG: hypothetical protein ACK4V6_06260 [Microthrixaceae bacterium]